MSQEERNTSGASNGATVEPGPADELTALRGELAELRDRYLRAQAEVVNTARRLGEEKSQAVRMANAAFARDLLVVVDNFERVMASLAHAREDDPVVQGIRLTYDALMKVLRDHQVTVIESVGKRFDPTMHEALMRQPTTEVPEGHVVAEMVRGYRMGDRVLRAAVVSVAKGPDESA